MNKNIIKHVIVSVLILPFALFMSGLLGGMLYADSIGGVFQVGIAVPFVVYSGTINYDAWNSGDGFGRASIFILIISHFIWFLFAMADGFPNLENSLKPKECYINIKEKDDG